MGLRIRALGSSTANTASEVARSSGSTPASLAFQAADQPTAPVRYIILYYTILYCTPLYYIILY